MSTSNKCASPQTKSISPKSKPTEHESQSNIFDNFCFTGSNTQIEPGQMLNNITNASLPHYSHDLSASKPAESFCGTNFLKEKDFLNDAPLVVGSSRSVSPFNIFSAIAFDSEQNVLSSTKAINTQIKNEVKQKETCGYQGKDQENKKSINGITQKYLPHLKTIYSFLLK